MKKFLEWIGGEDRGGPHDNLAATDNALKVGIFRRTCKSFNLNWKVEGDSLLVGSSFRPGAENVGSDIASQAMLVLKNVPGGVVEPVERGLPGNPSAAHMRWYRGVKDGVIYVRKNGVDPLFLALLSGKSEGKTESVDDYDNWYREFVGKFPVSDYENNQRDRNNLFTGRITWVLDELGEADKIWSYIGGVNASERNYYMLLNKLVARDYPEMASKWMEEGHGPASRW